MTVIDSIIPVKSVMKLFKIIGLSWNYLVAIVWQKNLPTLELIS